jgi:ABC-2 type transport system ATP-binding protein
VDKSPARTGQTSKENKFLRVIETLDLIKRFPQEKSYCELIMHPFKRKEIKALENINIQVEEGELFGLLGPNGAGKTTLIKILSTLVLPTEGSAFVNGYDVTKHEKKIKRIVGYIISEERSFYWRLTGRQNLLFFAKLNNLPTYLADRRIKELAGLIGLEDDMDKVFQNYSSGVKQKMAIARGLLTNPKILFLDEPTRYLDPIVTKNFRGFIKDFIVGETKKTVIIATNNMLEAEELCDRVAIFNKGKVKICESLTTIKRILNNKGRYILSLKGSLEYLQQNLPPILFNDGHLTLMPEHSSGDESLFEIEINAVKEDISEIIKKIVVAGIKIEACRHKEFSLNEVFARSIE